MRYFLNIEQLSSWETNLLDIWRTAGWRFTLEPLSWFITIYNFCVTRIDGRDIELVILWDLEAVIVTFYLVRCYLTTVVLTTGGTLWNRVMSSQFMVVQWIKWIHRDAPRFADPYFESSKNMASSHLDGKFHHLTVSTEAWNHGKKYGESSQNGPTIQVTEFF